MLTDQPTRVHTLFIAVFKPQPGFAHRLSALAETVNKRFDEKLWQVQFNNYVFRDLKRRVLCVVQPGQLFFETFGLTPWQEDLNGFVEVAQTIFDGMNVHTLERISFKAGALLDMGMSHEELVDQFFGSYLLPRKAFRQVSDDLYDLSVALYGKRAGRRFRIQLLPQTPDEAKAAFFAVPNLEAFVENRLVDSQIRDAWLAVIDKPCLNLDVEIFDEKVNTAQASSLIRESVRQADDIASDAVNYLRSLPSRRK